MEEMMSKISLCHSLYLLCLGGTLLCSGTALYLFIRLDIREAAEFLAGRRARREIRRLEEENHRKEENSPKEEEDLEGGSGPEEATELLADWGKETKDCG